MASTSQSLHRSFSSKKSKGYIDSDHITSFKKRKNHPHLTYNPDPAYNSFSNLLKVRSQLSIAVKLPVPMYSPEKNLTRKLLLKDQISIKSPNKIRISRTDRNKRQRLDSLDHLVKKCTEIQDDFNSSSALTGIKKYSNSMESLGKAIEKFQFEDLTNAHEEVLESEDLMRNDSKNIRQQISYVENIRKKSKQVWKFQSHAISRKTERLVALIAKKLNEKNFTMFN
ncbi:hypothetical protein SteCoe_18846 [Stentor coeruleus]|uniref:Uncharacterized protein n=1 Tax=Stentor coeruleus TaxID=5963 RepID=A0A1R2BVF4_9CILI|nr:hypothetical protein SteCoe_18846 [Stentor coeruleus]